MNSLQGFQVKALHSFVGVFPYMSCQVYLLSLYPYPTIISPKVNPQNIVYKKLRIPYIVLYRKQSVQLEKLNKSKKDYIT